MRRRARGFNLIEMMTAITVLAVLLALGVPSVAEWIRSSQVRGLAESVQNGLQRARNEALKRNRPVTFWLVTPAVGMPDASCALSSTSGSWVVSLDDPAGKCNVAASDSADPRIVEVFGSSAAVTVQALAADGATAASSVTFNGFGIPVATGTPIARINLSHPDAGARELRVEVSSSGGVRMCDRAAAITANANDPRRCQQPTP